MCSSSTRDARERGVEEREPAARDQPRGRERREQQQAEPARDAVARVGEQRDRDDVARRPARSAAGRSASARGSARSTGG